MTDTMNECNNDSPNEILDIQPLRTSVEINELAAALSKAQRAMRHPQKNKVAKVPMKSGGAYSYNYADLADVIDAVRGPFGDNGLSMIQVPFGSDGYKVGIVTRIMHSSGQWVEGTLFMPTADAKAQTIGSAITYGRRYALSPMAGIASDDDDDGNAAQGQTADTQLRPGRAQPSTTLNEKTSRMLAAFVEVGVSREALERHMGGTKVEAFTDSDVESLRALHTEVKTGVVKAQDVGSGAVKKAASTKDKLEEKFKK